MKKFFTKKRIIYGIIGLLILGFILSRVFKGPDISGIETVKVAKADVKQTVLATGQVTSQTDLSLSFKTSGFVNRVYVKVGDKVKQGQIIANLEQKDAGASLTQARGAYAQARANLQKVLDGSSSEEVAVAQVTLDNAIATLENTKAQQQVAVDNAYKTLLSSSLVANAGSGNSGSIELTISGAYNSKDQGSYKITIFNTGAGTKFQYSGLEQGSGDVSTTPVPLGSRGLNIQFSSTSVPTNNFWTVNIPNTQSTSYVTNYNAYQAALETQKSSVVSAENTVASARASLDLKKAKARPADLSVAEAQVTSALGQLQAAEASFENTIIRAPADGTITKIDIKPGELASALEEVAVLQDVGSLHIEANISEANIASLKLGQQVETTFDALGPDRKFKGEVKEVDPASTVVSGVVNYQVTVSVESLPEIKPGMTANIRILVAEKDGVLVIPQRAVISQDLKKMVRVVTDTTKKTYEEKEVTLGVEGDGGVVEVVSGLEENVEIVTLIKTK